jgi:hypothetical protein
MKRTFEEALEHRRSYYSIGSSSPVSDEELIRVVRQAVKHVPSAFNSQSTRIVLLLGDEHKKLWDIVKDTLKARILAEAFVKTEAKIDGCFASGHGTVLYFALGGLSVEVLAVPGHTPADVAYRIGEHVFVGDTLFMPDVGTARCDFPGGDAHQLYRSIRRLLALPESTQLMLCHDYPPAGRTEPAWMCTVAAQRAGNIHVHDGVDEATFVERRLARDRTLDMPTLLLPSVQVNIRAGQLPPAEANGVSYLKLPVNAL